MNQAYRLVWNPVQQCYTPAPETARGRGKQGGRARLRAIAAATLIATGVGSAFAAPTGGQVASGSAALAQKGSTLTVTQSSQKAVINWQSFSVASGETVNFVQPNASAVALNRVLGNEASAVFGKLNANGQVFLVNPNGIVFGKSAEVNVGGLVASTLNLSDADFLAGQHRFSGSSSAAVSNQGQIHADGGYIALLGAKVSNDGTLRAQLGSVALAAGQQTTLDFAGDKLISVSVEQGALQALAENHQLIQADGGSVTLSARAADRLVAAVVNNSGVIRAQTLQNRGGVISLLGDMQAGVVNVGGTLDASAPNGGNGGQVETSAAHVKVAADASVSTAAAQGAFGQWLIDPQDYTVAASGGDITGAALSSNLGSTNITLQSSSGASAGAGNLNVNDAVSWSANTRLTLTASNNVNINANLTASGANAGLAINPNTANGADSASGSGSFKLGQGATISLPNVSASSTSALLIGGTAYTVINSLGSATDSTALTLQGLAGNLGGHYALGSNIDASATSNWNGGAGFTPIGEAAHPFTGVLDGLGHTISGLKINRPDAQYVGLFGRVGAAGALRNLGLLGGAISGDVFVGALVGRNEGALDQVYAETPITGGTAVSESMGGLVGSNAGSISHAYATGQVTGSSSIGGLVGANTVTGVIDSAYATGQVIGVGYGDGGLVGQNVGTVSNAYASGAVSGFSFVGGLLGKNNGSLSSSYATGSVTGGSLVGGLIGFSIGPVASSYWNSDVKADGIGQGNAVGSNGLSSAQMHQTASFAGFSFTSAAGGPGWVLVNEDGSLNNAGGASGATRPMLASEYASNVGNAHQLQLIAMAPAAGYVLTRSIEASASASGKDVWGASGFVPLGTVASPFTGSLDGASFTVNSLMINALARDNVGLLGTLNGGTVRNIGLFGGSVSGGSHVGGLVGSASGGVISNVYAALSVSGAGSDVGGLVGQSTSGNSISTAYATGAVSGASRVGGLVGYSTGGSLDQSYASGSVGGASALGGLVGEAASATVTRSFWNSDVNPLGIGLGSASGASGLTSAQLKTQANFASATAVNGNVNPAWDFSSNWIQYEGYTAPLLRSFMTPLTVSANAASKVYNGQAYANLSVNYSSTPDSRLLGTLAIGGTAAGAKQAGSYTITPTGLYSNQQGYALNVLSNTLTITPASLSVLGSTVANKVYDGTLTATLSGGTLSGVVASDTVSVTRSGSFLSKNVGTGLAVISTSSLSGSSAGNYSLVQPTGLSASISAKTLIVGNTTVVADKVYDGSNSAVVSGGTITGAIAGDQLSFVQTASFADKRAGVARLVPYVNTLSGIDAGNYVLSSAGGQQRATISPKALTVLDNASGDKVYDSTTTANLNGSLGGVLAGDAVTLTGRFASSDVGTAKVVKYSNGLGGTDAANYSLVGTSGSTTASISPKTLTVTGTTAVDKVYDGTLDATLTGGGLVGLIGGDKVNLVQEGLYLDKNVASHKTVIAADKLSGTDAGNYLLVQPTGLSAGITPKALTVSGTKAANKDYDGTVAATISGGKLTGVVKGDTVALVQAGQFADKNAGTGKIVFYSNALSGADASNYVAASLTGTVKATIKPLLLEIDNDEVGFADKVYDGTTAATLEYASTLYGVIAGDKLALVQEGKFLNPNIGEERVVTFTNVLVGADRANYKLSSKGGRTTAEIMEP